MIKPQDGNQGKGVTVNITTREQLDMAYRVAAEIGEVMVERFLPGSDYRLLIVGDRMVAAQDHRAALAVPLHPDRLPQWTIAVQHLGAVRGDEVMTAVTAAGWAVPVKQGPAATIPSPQPDREIDFAVFRPSTALKVLKYSVLDEAVFSDHRAILIEVTLPSPKD